MKLFTWGPRLFVFIFVKHRTSRVLTRMSHCRPNLPSRSLISMSYRAKPTTRTVTKNNSARREGREHVRNIIIGRQRPIMASIAHALVNMTARSARTLLSITRREGSARAEYHDEKCWRGCSSPLYSDKQAL